MTTTRYKIGSYEIDGVDSSIPVEVPLDSENVFYDGEIDSVDNIQDAVDYLIDDDQRAKLLLLKEIANLLKDINYMLAEAIEIEE